MMSSPNPGPPTITQADDALQHGPRPLPLFLNLLWRETEGDLPLRETAFRGLARYQYVPRPPPVQAPPSIAAAGPARLLHHGGGGDRVPTVFIPSLINPPSILDLSPARSMLRNMAAARHDIYMVDWGVPSADDATLDLAGHVTQRLVPLLARFPRPPILIGYCLGGTLAIGAASVMPVHALATLAAPWHFDRLAPEDRAAVARLWEGAQPTCARLGYVPMELLQAGFWALDPKRTVRKYAAFADVKAGSEEERAFLAVEDWANAGPPLSYAAGRDLFERLYAGNETGAGSWAVGSKRVNPTALALPTLSVVSTADRIVPAAIAPPLADSRSIDLGHVGMVVSARARAALWEPLSCWLSQQGG
ncbi:MAG: alpha/beta fold hydrolase [Sphingobium sp.]